MAEHFDEQAAMQHYLVCGSEDCQKNGQFYCNDCGRPLCEQCRNEHLKSPDTKMHEIVIDIPEVILFPETNQEKGKIEPPEEVSTDMKVTEKQMDQSEQKSDVQQTLSLSPSVIKVNEYSVPGVQNACHISYKSGRFWVSDSRQNLVQTDLQGNLHQRIHTSSLFEGSHTVTQDEDLVYTDSDNNVIFKMTPDKIITEIINLKAEKYTPLSVHSSRINGDLLVGMIAWEESRLTRYSKTGKEIQNIQWDDEGKELYEYPNYITENINGDICTSDYDKNAVVVVDKSGEYRFSYEGQEDLTFFPRGICTDTLGHILVCEEDGDVYLLDQDGGFLSFVLSFQQGLRFLHGLCLDDENNLYVGQYFTKTLTVYKYLK